MVFLDVVYNHFGPEGNYLGRYAPALLRRGDIDAVGRADRLRRAGGARLRDRERAALARSIIASTGCGSTPCTRSSSRASRRCSSDLSRAVGALARRDRAAHPSGAGERRQRRAACSIRRPEPPAGKYRAQWNDDYHHAWHVLLTGEDARLLPRLRAGRPAARIARTLGAGFAYQGEPSRASRRRQRAASRAAHLPPTAFVSFLQNHDQIGNRAARRAARRARAGAPRSRRRSPCMLLAPMPPLLFMGEEWGAPQPFPFFCDFEGDLAEAVREGRREEFADAYGTSRDRRRGARPARRGDVARRRARLERARRSRAHARRLDLVARAARRRAVRMWCRCSPAVDGAGADATCERRAC